MEEKKGSKLYSPALKWTILGIQMLCVILVVVCSGVSFCIVNGLGTPYELIEGMPCEETEKFSSNVYEQMVQVQDYLQVSSAYESKGALDLNKTIDITNLKLTDKAKQNPNTTYTVGAIKEMVNSGENDEIQLIIDEAPYYDSMAEVDGVVEGEVAEEVKESIERYSAAFAYLYENGKIHEKELPISGVSLAEYAMENRKDVSLRDLYLYLCSLCSDYSAYEKHIAENQDTGNLKYFILNTQTKEYYTNAEWDSIEEAWKNVKDENLAIHYRKTPRNAEFMDSNNPGTQWLGHTLKNISFYGDQEEVVIGVDSTYPAVDWLQQYRNDYMNYQPFFLPLLVAIGLSFLMGVICFIIATVQTGRTKKDGSVRLNAFDRIPTEVCLAFLVIVIVAILSVTVSVTGIALSNSNVVDIVAQSLLLFAGVMLFMILYLSLARRVKAKTLWQNSICRAIVGMGRRVYEARNTSRKVLIVLAFFLVLHIFLIWAMQGLGVLMLLVLDVLVLLYLMKEVAGRQTVKTGLANIAAGDLDYKIDLSDLQGDNLEMAEAVNQVAEGLQLAVEKGMKDERMRSELITNVSHDIKTPLTSIINYVDLLKREEIEDEKIKGYIRVLEAKTQRLKHLTEDLVEASKISTGNVELQLGRMYMQEMLKQAYGEFDNKFEKRNLDTVLTMAEQPIIIWADGRQMWRIFENILSNIAKYALAGTRVYIDLRIVKRKAVLMFKNISEEPLNISAEELSERFVRGDASRTTEGSGLGLSIARSLTELQDGEFEIYLDGDLFKVTIMFELMVE